MDHRGNAVLRVLRWLSMGVLVALLLVAAVWATSRLMPMPAEQRQALALLRQAPPAGERNAFDALWLLDFDGIPDATRAALIDEDGQRIAMLAAQPVDEAVPPSAMVRSAQGRYPQVPELDLPCRWNSDDCLGQLRRDPASAEAALQGQQALLARIAALSGYDHYRNRFVPDARVPLPAWQLLQRPLAAHALAHVQGRSDEALAGLCNDTRTAKMLMSRSDTLVSSVLGAAMIQGNVRLLGDVLAELPMDHALPAACDGVFVAAMPAALSLCPAMRGEFELVTRDVAEMDQPMAWLAWDREKSAGLQALAMQDACTTRAAEALAADLPLKVERKVRSSWRLECVANVIGCIHGSIAAPAYDGFGLRLQDAGAGLRLAEGLLWLRANPGTDAVAALAAMPATLRDGARPLQLSADGRYLQVATYSQRKNSAPLRVRLPDGMAAE